MLFRRCYSGSHVSHVRQRDGIETRQWRCRGRNLNLQSEGLCGAATLTSLSGLFKSFTSKRQQTEEALNLVFRAETREQRGGGRSSKVKSNMLWGKHTQRVSHGVQPTDICVPPLPRNSTPPSPHSTNKLSTSLYQLLSVCSDSGLALKHPERL